MRSRKKVTVSEKVPENSNAAKASNSAKASDSAKASNSAETNVLNAAKTNVSNATNVANAKAPEAEKKSARRKKSRKILGRFMKSSKKYHGWMILSLILAMLSVAASVGIPKILGEITNIAIATYPEIDFSSIVGLVFLTLGLLVISAGLNYAQAYIMTVASSKYVQDLRNQIFEKIGRLPVSFIDWNNYGDTLSRMTNDVEIIDTSLSQEITDATLSASTLLGVMIMMLTINIPISLIVFIIVPLSVFVVGKIMKNAQKYFLSRQNSLGKLNNIIEEDYSGLVVIKSNSHEDESVAEFLETNEKLAKLSEKSQFLSSLSMPATHMFTNLGNVVVAVLGGAMAISGKISIGSLQALVQYVSRFNRPITEIASTTSTIQRLVASVQRIFEFLDEPEEPADFSPARKIEKVKGEVEFHHVNFGYFKDKTIIHDFSVKIAPGMKVAIVGPTGAGKTTIINLLMRFYDPTSGYITIDGVPTTEMKRADVRKMFGMVLQDTWLFNGTVEDNLRYGKQSATLTEIRKAAKMSNVHHVIEALPNNYHAEISEDSDNISAGEKQLITIARAMVAEPPMMILDEATSNVDTRTEQLIQDSFEKLTKGRTSFVIAHRLSTIRNSDLILVMKDGDIVEQGTHEKLLKAGGFYAELYNSQFED